jgi:RNA polymerase sigma factor (sigma-70 family)
MDINDERALMKDIREKPKNFGIFFDEYYPTIYRYILKCTADPEIAQDIASETFLKAFQNIGKFKWQEITICNWFYKIASNELRMYFRKSKYNSESLEDLYETTGFDPKGNQDLVQELLEVEAMIEREDDFLKMHKILSGL